MPSISPQGEKIMPQSRRDFLKSTAAASLASATAGAMTRSQAQSAAVPPPTDFDNVKGTHQTGL